MRIFTEVLGNINNSEEWKKKMEAVRVDEIYLDQWTAQKSRFLAKGVSGAEYPVALKRNTHVADGDVLLYDEAEGKGVVLRLELNPVLVVDLSGIAEKDHDTIIRISLELGHAIGNQHWPAVVKGTKVYVPLCVDKKVMLSVLETHNIPGITYKFEKGLDVIPYLAPSETRELFGAPAMRAMPTCMTTTATSCISTSTPTPTPTAPRIATRTVRPMRSTAIAMRSIPIPIRTPTAHAIAIPTTRWTLPISTPMTMATAIAMTPRKTPSIDPSTEETWPKTKLPSRVDIL